MLIVGSSTMGARQITLTMSATLFVCLVGLLTGTPRDKNIRPSSRTLLKGTAFVVNAPKVRGAVMHRIRMGFATMQKQLGFVLDHIHPVEAFSHSECISLLRAIGGKLSPEEEESGAIPKSYLEDACELWGHVLRRSL
jgi:hypothetical protein